MTMNIIISDNNEDDDEHDNKYNDDDNDVSNILVNDVIVNSFHFIFIAVLQTE